MRGKGSAEAHANRHGEAPPYDTRAIGATCTHRGSAHSLLILEGYLSAGKRQDMPGLFANSRIPKNVQELLSSEAIAEEADRDIRDLSPRLAQIRRLIGKIAERNTRRQVLIPALPHCEEDRKRQQAILEGVLASLQRVDEATKDLCRRFQQFNPAAIPTYVGGLATIQERDSRGSDKARILVVEVAIHVSQV